MRATKALIHLDHLRDNIALVRKKTGTRICMPVKADAYGHGYLAIAKTALNSGVEYLATATVREGEELREGGITAPILLLSIPLPSELDSLITAGLEPLVGDSEYIDALESCSARAGKKISLHLKIDTGMGRIGCKPEDASRLASRIVESKSFTLAGTATHLAVSDSIKTEDIVYTKKQLEIFRNAVNSISARGINPGIIHSANTGAVTFHNDGWFDMVRPGILLYGYAPEGPDGNPAMAVKPLMELTSCLSYIKEVKKGESISYGRTWTAGKDTLIGTIPLGYADGLPRLLSNNWQIHIMKKKSGKTETVENIRPLVGRICMDQCMVDLGKDSTARRWDTVTIFGGAAPHAGIMASRLGTIPYEITCQINKRVPRIYT
jgi:alanine racemase